MMPIDMHYLEKKFPDGWLDSAKASLDGVRNLDRKARALAINKKPLWTELKKILMEASCKKCWYCESRNVGADNAVDHYRPKNRVHEVADHDGYWWLAYEWTNYRFSCTFCNTWHNRETAGGKQDRFPLWNEKWRARAEIDPLIDEQPLLLDPACAADVALLTFEEDGRAVPVYAKEKSAYWHKRAETSIHCYHLNHPDLVETRVGLLLKVKKAFTAADKHFRRAAQGDLAADQAWRDDLALLRDAVSRNAEYSATARAFIGGQRPNPVAVELFKIAW